MKNVYPFPRALTAVKGNAAGVAVLHFFRVAVAEHTSVGSLYVLLSVSTTLCSTLRRHPTT